MKIGTLVALMAIVASAALALATIVPVEAGRFGTLTVGSLNLRVGDEGTLEIRALYLGPPGLGAWTFDLLRDPDVISTVSCEGASGGVCGPAFSPQSDRVTGASEGGLIGEATLARFTFRCEREGESPLTVEINVWASSDYASRGSDLDIVDGSVACAARAEATKLQPPPVSTPAVALPQTGGLRGERSSIIGWPIPALATLGALALIAGAALARKAR